MKKEIFNKCLEAIEETTDMKFPKIMQSRTDEAVCARMLLVRVLTDVGFSESDIREYTFMKQQRINYLKNESTTRMMHNRMFAALYEEVKKSLPIIHK